MQDQTSSALRMFWIYVFLISQGSFARVNVCTAISILAAVELDALLQFKLHYIAKGSQHVLWSWHPGNISNVCESSWLGVTCTPAGHHIQGIDLEGFGLEGSIAPHLGNLSFLSTLSLAHNSFTGSIPTQLMGCASLQVLDLHSNKLSAPITSSLTSLPFLRVFNLCNNNLSGIIPSAMFSNMSTALTQLSLCSNSLTGSIPPNLGLHLPNVKVLSLSQNHLTGSIPLNVANCTNLISLELNANNLSGSIPSFVLSGISLPHLQHLNLCNNTLSGGLISTNISTSLLDLLLCNNTLSGSIPPNLGLHFPNLKLLSLSQNHLTGSIPPSLANCTNLIVLGLGTNLLTGSIPSFLLPISLSHLQYLNLCNNALTGLLNISTNISTSLMSLLLCNNVLTGSIPADLGLHLPNLQVLDLSQNPFTGAYIPSSLGNCTNLTLLVLGSIQLIGPIPEELGLLHNLQILVLYENNLTGGIPRSLSNCSNLIVLLLSFNQLTGPVPPWLGRLGDVVQTIILGHNNLTGAIPPSIGNCTSLSLLELAGNQLSGNIPWELALLSNVEKIGLADNVLVGSIPSSLGNCTRLTHLFLGMNQLRGMIPAQFTMLGQVEILNFAANHLAGPLQRLDFSNFTKLISLEVHFNELSGSLTRIDFAKSQQLQVLDLGGNHFTGEIPWGSLTNCTFLYVLELSNNQLNGAIPISILGRFPGLQFLYLQHNLLRGEFPMSAEFDNQLHLLELDLSFNHLNGTLPSSLSYALLTLEGYLNLSHNDFSGSIPVWLGQFVKVVAIDLSHNNFTGGIPESLGDCTGLIALDLSKNRLSGNLPLQLGSLTYLKTLDLSYNNLSGVLPSFLGTRLLQLQMLNVSFNNFTGPIPTHEGVFRHLTASCFQGNPGLCGQVLNKTCISLVQKHHHVHHVISLSDLRSRRWILPITIVLSLTLLLLLLVTRRYICRSLSEPTNEAGHIRLPEVRHYTAKELMEATQGYSDVSLLGQGAIGVVYRGELSDGRIVAVKRIRDEYRNSHEALLQEMRILSKLRHRNLVQVLGCVLNLDLKALVLEYMENGSLEHYLQAENRQLTVGGGISAPRYWEMVSRVAMGIAHALAYLHHEYGESIIHGDVKPSNILLDSDLEPHLADFGLAKLLKRGAEAVSITSEFQGSIGYMAPEYAYAARITTEVDVFSYGVVLLRMLTGTSPTEVVPHGLSLHEWAKSKLASAEGGDLARWEELLDGALHVNRTAVLSHNQRSQAVVQLLRMALSCTAQNPEDRPTFHEVLAFLITSQKAISELTLNYIL